MRIITVAADRDITALAQQVFTVPASNRERLSRAVEALLEANPQLSGKTTVPAGTPIVVPERPDLPLRAADPGPDGGFDDLQSQARAALNFAKSALDSSRAQAAQSAKDSLEVLKARDFRALAATANLSVDSLTRQVNDEAKAAETQAQLDLQGVDALEKALEEFLKTLGASDGTT